MSMSAERLFGAVSFGASDWRGALSCAATTLSCKSAAHNTSAMQRSQTIGTTVFRIMVSPLWIATARPRSESKLRFVFGGDVSQDRSYRAACSVVLIRGLWSSLAPAPRAALSSTSRIWPTPQENLCRRRNGAWENLGPAREPAPISFASLRARWTRQRSRAGTCQAGRGTHHCRWQDELPPSGETAATRRRTRREQSAETAFDVGAFAEREPSSTRIENTAATVSGSRSGWCIGT